ncbi:nucleotidyltransferase domain-containing protein [Ramlibacter sp.]|uniref:nucleotidyltransferase domain-containing protein n=1 Tax=Ramlibacter sp. TaxID=1917967 RepID=UPI003D0B2C9C
MQRSSVQSFVRFPLTQLLASGGHVRVLRALLAHGGPQSAGQLAADCAMTARGVRNTLDALVAQGAVKVLGPAGARLFAPALEQPLVAALAQLFESERQHWLGLQEELREGLAAEKQIRSAWLYGSVARGTDEPGSDMDVAVVLANDSVDASRRVRDALQALGDRLGVQISTVMLTPSELVKLPPGDRWWSEVCRDAKVLKGVAPAREAARCAKAAQSA